MKKHNRKILVTGGCGYIGSHTLVDLLEHDFEALSLDSLINSDERVLQGIAKITNVHIKNYTYDLCHLEKTRRVFLENPDIAGIIHFAALKSVNESVKNPLYYYQNNINSLINVLKCVAEFKVSHFIFSSSCSVYGNAKDLPVTEQTPFQEAESPYGYTKQIGERMLRDFAKSNPYTNIVLLRYFNPAGAHTSAKIGENPINLATSLVPVITSTAIGDRASMTVFGTNYNTRDGSCVRDFIHVMDLARAHTQALEYIMNRKNDHQVEVFNLGTGKGVTVLEAIHAFEEATNQKLRYELGNPRAGDVIAVYANCEAATQRLGWQPKYSLRDIMRSAWQWEQDRKTIYQ